MKRLWFAGVFLLVALLACSYEQYMVKYTYKEINGIIDSALNTDNQSEKAEYCSEISEKWDKRVKTLTLFTDHSITQSADVSFGTLKSLSENNSENIDETLIETKSELQQIYDSSRINFSNIF
ncbi:MAG: DUF4363 family protein [Eubacterium sp.]|nr:DUF4363 family protein [Eubacterium sp.]